MTEKTSAGEPYLVQKSHGVGSWLFKIREHIAAVAGAGAAAAIAVEKINEIYLLLQ